MQLWLGTPDVDNRPPPYRVTDADVAALREIYAVRNDNMPAWIAENGGTEKPGARAGASGQVLRRSWRAF